MAPSLILFSVVLALSSAALDESPEIDNPFITLPLCQSGWSPLGTDYQPLALFPYQLKCTPSTDGTFVTMSITGDPERGVVHALVAATSESGDVLANGEYDFLKATNYRSLTCDPSEEERASILVKTDSAPQAEMEISWTLPDGVKIDDVYCRFFVAEGIKTYWQDIQVPAKPATETASDDVETEAPQTVEQTVESKSEVEAPGGETETKTSETDVPETPAEPNPRTQPAVTESEVEGSGDETEATTPATVVVETEVESEAVDEVGSGDEPIIVTKPVDTKAVDATERGPADAPPPAQTDSDEGQEEKVEFQVDAQGRQILTEKAEMKFSFNGEDHASSHYCGSSGTMYFIKRGSDCDTFYMGTAKDGEDSPKILGEFKCAPGLAFNSNICACDYKKTIICPDSTN